MIWIRGEWTTDWADQTDSHRSDPRRSAIIYAGLGEMDETFKWLEKCYEERDPWIRGLKIDPMFDSVRKDARFAGLLRRVVLN